MITSSIYHPQYNEQEALQQLKNAAEIALNRSNEEYEQSDDSDYHYEQLTITVDGKSFALVLGGPQFQALINFIDHIAYENMYVITDEVVDR
jgi:hypothetical protein